MPSEVRRCVSLLLLVPPVCAWLSLAGAAHWLLDLCAHFHWQYLVACVIGLTWFGLRREWKATAFAAATLGLLVIRLSGSGGTQAPSPATPGCRVISFNVLSSNTNRGEVVDYLRRADADVVFLAEINRDWATALEALHPLYPHRLVSSSEDNFGLACYSRLPDTRMETAALGDKFLKVLIVRTRTAAGPLTLVGIHPPPPFGGVLTRRRDAQLAAVRDFVRNLGTPALVIGDFNATPWSEGLRIAREGGTLDYRCVRSASRPTWRTNGPFALPIDHALCTRDLFITRRDIGPGLGSDHRPQELDIVHLAPDAPH